MILVIGSGVAGLSCALAAVREGSAVTLLTAGRLRPVDAPGGGSTALAQGGIAAAIHPDDSVQDHLADTIAAGGGIVDAEAAEVLVREGAGAVRALLAAGFPADRDDAGELRMGLEAAHGFSRIVHAGGDRTGAVLHAFLVEQALTEVVAGRIELVEDRSAVSLIAERGAVRGAVVRDSSGSTRELRADAVVLATGGYAALYPRSTNPASSRGEGIVLAARAGAAVADLEFVQLHPTVLRGTGALISEAVRGAGAVLRDGDGHRYMVDRHPLAELAPRDVVSRETERVLAERGEDAVWLDATNIDREGGAGSFARRFPGIAASLAAHGLDAAREPIPVAPAAHYTMGGVASDLDGRSTVPGLFVAGEVASTGVHGANRLASNSLLEGLVFGRRAGVAAVAHTRDGQAGRDSWQLHGSGMRALAAAAQTADAGVADGETSPLSRMIAIAAEARTESRGAHQRSDYPRTDPEQARRRAFCFAFAEVPADPAPAVAADAPAPSLSEQRSLAAC